MKNNIIYKILLGIFVIGFPSLLFGALPTAVNSQITDATTNTLVYEIKPNVIIQTQVNKSNQVMIAIKCNAQTYYMDTLLSVQSPRGFINNAPCAKGENSFTLNIRQPGSNTVVLTSSPLGSNIVIATW